MEAYSEAPFGKLQEIAAAGKTKLAKALDKRGIRLP